MSFIFLARGDIWLCNIKCVNFIQTTKCTVRSLYKYRNESSQFTSILDVAFAPRVRVRQLSPPNKCCTLISTLSFDGSYGFSLSGISNTLGIAARCSFTKYRTRSATCVRARAPASVPRRLFSLRPHAPRSPSDGWRLSLIRAYHSRSRTHYLRDEQNRDVLARGELFKSLRDLHLRRLLVDDEVIHSLSFINVPDAGE